MLPLSDAPSSGYKRALLSPRASLDSLDSALRDLELSENVLLVDTPLSAHAKTFPLTPLDFEHDLLPLTADLSGDGFAAATAAPPQPQSKNLSLLNGQANCLVRVDSIHEHRQALPSSSVCRSVPAFCECPARLLSRMARNQRIYLPFIAIQLRLMCSTSHALWLEEWWLLNS